MIARRASVLAVATLVVACGVLSSSTPVIGIEMDGGGDGRTLTVLYGGCDGGLPIAVSEEDDRVVLEVAPGQPNCDAIQTSRVRLDAPLDDRVVVDGSTGEVVASSSEGG